MRSRKGSIAIGIILLVAGIATCVVSFSVLGFDPEKSVNVQFSENTYEVKESFRDIEIKSSIEHVRFAVSSDGRCRVSTYCPDTISTEVMVEGDCLKIRTVDEGGVKRSPLVELEPLEFLAERLGVVEIKVPPHRQIEKRFQVDPVRKQWRESLYHPAELISCRFCHGRYWLPLFSAPAISEEIAQFGQPSCDLHHDDGDENDKG